MDAVVEKTLTNRHSYNLLETWKHIRASDTNTSNWQRTSRRQPSIYKGRPMAASKKPFTRGLGVECDWRMQLLVKWTTSSREFQTVPHK